MKFRFALAVSALALSFQFAPSQAFAGGCEVAEVNSGIPNALSALEYTPKRGKKTYDPGKTVIVLPSTANMTLLEKIQARKLCNRGIRAMVLKDWKFEALDRSRLDYFNVILENGLIFTDYVLGRFQGSMGIVGSSLGGVVASVAKGLRPRIGPAVLIVAGADLPELLAYTVSPEWVKVQEAQMAALRTTDRAVLQAALTPVILYEPGALAFPSMSKDIRFVGSETDRKVFPKNQTALWEAWGKPQWVSFYFDHVPTIVASQLFLSGSHARFLRRRL